MSQQEDDIDEKKDDIQKIDAKLSSADVRDKVRTEVKFKGGLYSGIGTGIQYKNFVVDLSYNWNRIRVDRKGYVTPYRYEDKFTISHGTLTLGVGYSFGF